MANLLKIFRWIILVSILSLSFILMVNASKQESAIMDELAHIPAGYGYVRYLDYRLNPEHPPLVKIFAALPLLFQKINFPTKSGAWTNNVNGQWATGTEFLYESGNNADQIIYWSRIGPIILTLVLILLIYIEAAGIIGRWWALLPTFLFALSPTILAHGHYVTTDIGATLGVILATAAFLKFLLKPSRKNLILAGLAFGIAQLLKFSNALLIPYFLFLIAVFYLTGVVRDWHSTDTGQRLRRFWIRGIRYVRSVTIIFAIGYLLVYGIYLIVTWNYPVEKQAADTAYILTSFNPRWLANLDISMTKNPILRPLAEYFLGILMVLQRTAGGNTVYFLGEVSAAGWWYYFPLTFLMKESIPALLIISGALLFGIWEFLKNIWGAIFKKSGAIFMYFNTQFPEFAMAVFVILYWGYSMSGNLNIGVRHLLPTLPFIYILSAGAIKKWFAVNDALRIRNFLVQIFVLAKTLFGLSVKSLILAGLLLWFLISSLTAYPYFLSYFNLAAGGINKGYKYVTDSNYDWGQDLKRLTEWTNKNLAPEEKIAVDYFGGGTPKYYLGERAEPWWSAKGTPLTDGIKWLAVSINTIQAAKGQPATGYQRKPEDEYQWLKNPYQPYARAGTSIFIYKLD